MHGEYGTQANGPYYLRYNSSYGVFIEYSKNYCVFGAAATSSGSDASTQAPAWGYLYDFAQGKVLADKTIPNDSTGMMLMNSATVLGNCTCKTQGGGMDVAEILIYDRTLSTEERKGVVNWLANKYNSN